MTPETELFGEASRAVAWGTPDISPAGLAKVVAKNVRYPRWTRELKRRSMIEKQFADQDASAMPEDLVIAEAYHEEGSIIEALAVTPVDDIDPFIDWMESRRQSLQDALVRDLPLLDVDTKGKVEVLVETGIVGAHTAGLLELATEQVQVRAFGSLEAGYEGMLGYVSSGDDGKIEVGLTNMFADTTGMSGFTEVTTDVYFHEMFGHATAAASSTGYVREFTLGTTGLVLDELCATHLTDVANNGDPDTLSPLLREKPSFAYAAVREAVHVAQAHTGSTHRVTDYASEYHGDAAGPNVGLRKSLYDDLSYALRETYGFDDGYRQFEKELGNRGPIAGIYYLCGLVDTYNTREGITAAPLADRLVERGLLLPMPKASDYARPEVGDPNKSWLRSIFRRA